MNNGKQFELNFIRALNNKNYDELNENLKRFISFIFKDSNYDDKITCKKMQLYQKADVAIKIGTITKYISLKSGSQNSVHVEKIETFIKFLLDNNINKSIVDNLLMYHYGDDTLIGNGSLRYSAEELKVKYEKQIYDFNKYINYYENKQ